MDLVRYGVMAFSLVPLALIILSAELVSPNDLHWFAPFIAGFALNLIYLWNSRPEGRLGRVARLASFWLLAKERELKQRSRGDSF